ncbi:MAG TPA: hypothetical protein VJ725_31090 [Thermoanaerobaculia bacterium]|nr:hypothetical protein [Thermoanaerobaculia bacterium]
MASADNTDPTMEKDPDFEKTPPEEIQPIPATDVKPTRGPKEPPPDPPRS